MTSDHDEDQQIMRQQQRQYDDKDDDEIINRAMAHLQLPHMPPLAPQSSSASTRDVDGGGTHTADVRRKLPFTSLDDAGNEASSSHHDAQNNASDHSLLPPQPPQQQQLPTIKILVVADVDLTSASAFAEYTLLQRNELFDTRRIDLCLACGPFCRDTDLRPYQHGNSRQRQRDVQQQQQQQQQQQSQPPQDLDWSQPYLRSKEDTASLEGLMTAALSQLESIVCRVIYCPGSTDPLTTLSSSKKNTEAAPSSASGKPAAKPSAYHNDKSSNQQQQRQHNYSSRRLTPNSRNVHQQWIPIAPGLGCGGLLYLDVPLSSSPPAAEKEPSAATKTTTPANTVAAYHTTGNEEYPHDNNNDDLLPANIRRVLKGGISSTSSFGDDEDDCDVDSDEGCHPHDPDDDDDDDDDDDENDGENAIDTFLSHQIQFQLSAASAANNNSHSSADSSKKPAAATSNNNTTTTTYESTLERLLRLAPRPQHQVPFATGKGQSILLTHYVDPAGEDKPAEAVAVADNDNDDAKPAAATKSSAASSLRRDHLPWPQQHETFVETSNTAQDLLCLEIASGAAATNPAQLVTRGKTHLLIPGSLRQRGEFCLLDIALVQMRSSSDSASDDDDDDDGDKHEDKKPPPTKKPAAATIVSTSGKLPQHGGRHNTSSLHPPQFQWMVRNVDFHNMPMEGRRV